MSALQADSGVVRIARGVDWGCAGRRAFWEVSLIRMLRIGAEIEQCSIDAAGQ